MQTSSQFRKPSSPLKPKHQKYITSHQCAPIGCTRQEVGSLHSLETTSHSLQQTYLRLLIHTTQNFKWSRYILPTLNTSLMKTGIYSLRHHIHALQTVNTDIQHCIQHIANSPHLVLTGDVNAHPTFWHSYTEDHRE